ncbi:hypothetical protein JWJ90_08885 [Desulfobulbus rhabdoformis]|uniref:hypothetical protein n=1 Tax=Desulfobulbus rhabdoformis TaxID=34032 RepID=UPI001963023C|nr:hypothetical protein [Desulfobulbus rhabdoformis]MBM9614405.1 hypothetical protein [Desulfobulbus rhabdoformis]
MTKTSPPLDPLNTAVLFLVFNRPETTVRALKAIRKAKPLRLYVAADGPRKEREGEPERVAKTREIATAVDWPCEVKKLFRKDNLGCKNAVSSAITWFFEHEEQGIIIEDDCVAHPDFFTFCDGLLERYAEDERVWVVTGNNFQDGRKHGDSSYYFSKYNHCWGWATWRRAWQHYQGDLPFWPQWQDSNDWLKKTPDQLERRYWNTIFDQVMAGAIDSWAYLWTANVWHGGGLTATPNANLVTNIGFGPDATHTLTATEQDGVPTQPLGPLTHPSLIEQDRHADQYVFDHHFGGIHQRLHRRMIDLPKRIIRFALRIIRRRSEKPLI